MLAAFYYKSPHCGIVCLDRLVTPKIELEVLTLGFVQDVTVQPSTKKQFTVILNGPCESWRPIYRTIVSTIALHSGERVNGDALLESICEDSEIIGTPGD